MPKCGRDLSPEAAGGLESLEGDPEKKSPGDGKKPSECWGEGSQPTPRPNSFALREPPQCFLRLFPHLFGGRSFGAQFQGLLLRVPESPRGLECARAGLAAKKREAAGAFNWNKRRLKGGQKGGQLELCSRRHKRRAPGGEAGAGPPAQKPPPLRAGGLGPGPAEGASANKYSVRHREGKKRAPAARAAVSGDEMKWGGGCRRWTPCLLRLPSFRCGSGASQKC